MTSYLTYKQWLLPHNSLKFFHAPFSVFCSRLSIPSFIFWRKIRHIDYSLLNLWYAQIFSFLSSLVKPYFLDLSKKVSIYADELELKKENKDSGKAFFFGPFKKVHDRKFVTVLFDKRDGFPFYINRTTSFDSNEPSKIYYAYVDFEILCIARTTKDLIDMATRVICYW